MSAKALIQPLQLGPVTLKNRVIMSALTRNRAIPDTVPNDLNVEYYRQRSNAGLIVTEATLITRQGTEWPWAPGIWNKEQISGWKKVVKAVHEEGGIMFCQLWHLGRVLHPEAPEQIASGEPVWGPSAIAAAGGKFRHIPGQPGYVTPKEIDDPERFIALYKQAAINAKEAGFDGVELHGANGYLVHQFLDSTSNQRTDSWGGSVENRARFGLEVLKALVEVWGSDRVAVRISPAGGYNDMGMPLQESLDTFSYFVSEADKLKLAYIIFVRHNTLMDPQGRGTPHDVIESYGHLIKNAKRFFNSGFTGEEAGALVSSGTADAVAFGVPYIAHPDLAKRFEFGKSLDNVPDWVTFFHGQGRDLAVVAKGYTDYPAAKYD